MSAVFSRVRGSSGFSLLLASLRFGRGGLGVGLLGVSRVRGWCARFLLPVGGGLGASGAPGSCVFVRGLGACAPGSCSPVFWGVGVGCVCASGSFLGCGFRGWVGRPGSFWGLGVPGFLVRVRGGFLSCSRRGFRVFLFPLGASLLWFGGCRVGLGLFFSGCYCLARAGAGSSLVVGLVLVWVWFCLESLILAQDERWRRA